MPTDVNQYKALSYSQLQPIQGYLIFQANKLQQHTVTIAELKNMACLQFPLRTHQKRSWNYVVWDFNI